GGEVKKRKSNVKVMIGSSLDSGFPLLNEVADIIPTQDGGLNESNTVTDGFTGQVSEATVVPGQVTDVTSASGNTSTPNELDANVPSDADYDIWLPLALVHKMDKGKGGSIGADDEGFIEVKKKKSSGQMGNKASMSCVQEEGQHFIPLVEKINILKKHMLEEKCVLVDDDDKPLEKVEYSSDLGSEDEVESVENEMESYLTSKPLGVGYGT
ncbi:hypothetical protein Tco_0665396, partial [Tanacetum coccineum]